MLRVHHVGAASGVWLTYWLWPYVQAHHWGHPRLVHHGRSGAMHRRCWHLPHGLLTQCVWFIPHAFTFAGPSPADVMEQFTRQFGRPVSCLSELAHAAHCHDLAGWMVACMTACFLRCSTCRLCGPSAFINASAPNLQHVRCINMSSWQRA
jgi:hypothetical protein